MNKIGYFILGFLLGMVGMWALLTLPNNAEACCRPTPEPVCETEAWSCEACQNNPNDYRERLGVCYDEFKNYCAINYGCGFVGECVPDWICKDECEPEPTPTPEPTPEPCTENCDAPPVSPNTFRTEATCNGIMPTAPVCTVGHFVDGDTAYLGWWKYQDSADKLMLRYGYSPDALIYGIDSIPTDSEGMEVNEVDTSGHIFYQLGVDRGECVSWSLTCDP